MSRPLHAVLSLLALLAASVAAAQAVPSVEDQRRLDSALAGLKAQRAGTVDAYVVVAALDSAPVFSREAREAGRVLGRRFDAAGRTLVLAEDEPSDRADCAASPETLARALAGVASLMDRDEDVLVLYVTSHGSPRAGLNFRDPERGEAVIAPAQLAAMLDQPGIENRLIILQACYSGQFVPSLKRPRAVVATSSSSMTPSFGCSAGNDWTFFGYALINQAMRQPDSFFRQFRRAFVTILGWEQQLKFEASNPEISIGSERPTGSRRSMREPRERRARQSAGFRRKSSNKPCEH
jgi:hypothetical protein